MTKTTFNLASATKAEALEKAYKFLDIAVRCDGEEGSQKKTEMAFNAAVKHESAAFDGRA